MTYSQVVDLFQTEQVKSFVVEDNIITLQLHNPYNGEKEVEADLADIGKPFFLEEDFKKKDGFKVSLQRSKDLNLYRQAYCGCEFCRNRKYILRQVYIASRGK